MHINRNILDIYENYKIMPNLQEHMLRVASVAKLIVNNLNEDIIIDKEKLTIACLLHDMGNIIKFRLNFFPEFLEPQGLEYWQNVQNEYFAKYGKDEHYATGIIMREIAVREDICSMVDGMLFSALCIHSTIKTSLELRIFHYADLRVGPYGVISFEERVADVTKRYADVPHDEFNQIEQSTRTELIACGKDIEQQIFAICKIKPEDITDESIKDVMEELKGFVVR
ncbi:MAG: HD domain-containing protein [bacterium]|nr:HD domain-containing protein [bacterium]